MWVYCARMDGWMGLSSGWMDGWMWVYGAVYWALSLSLSLSLLSRAAKDRELLALLKGELSSEEYKELRAANASAVAAQKDKAAEMRQARVDKLAAQSAPRNDP